MCLLMNGILVLVPEGEVLMGAETVVLDLEGDVLVEVVTGVVVDPYLDLVDEIFIRSVVLPRNMQDNFESKVRIENKNRECRIHSSHKKIRIRF